MKKTCSIRITQVPDGEPPPDIRAAWVGLVLPCDPYLGFPDSGLEEGVLTGAKAVRNRCGFSVRQDAAIRILEQDRPDAAAWWRSHGFPRAGQYFGFSEDEAEIVSGVRRQQLIHVTEEMMGDQYR